MRIGYEICDMHYGLDLPEGAEVVSQTSVYTECGSEVINLMVRKEIPDYQYLNKMLVVVGENSDGDIVAAYSYDDRNLVMLTIDGLL